MQLLPSSNILHNGLIAKKEIQRATSDSSSYSTWVAYWLKKLETYVQLRKDIYLPYLSINP